MCCNPQVVETLDNSTIHALLPSETHLVLIDGGVGQLNVAIKVFSELGISDRVDLISISKDDKHKSSVIHLTDGRTASIKDNLNFTFLGVIQEEVHRFAIKFHREKRGKKMVGK